MAHTKLKTDAEGRLEDIRLRFDDVPACCHSGTTGCSWQLVRQGDGYSNTDTVQIVCCGCGEPLEIEDTYDDDEEE